MNTKVKIILAALTVMGLFTTGALAQSANGGQGGSGFVNIISDSGNGIYGDIYGGIYGVGGPGGSGGFAGNIVDSLNNCGSGSLMGLFGGLLGLGFIRSPGPRRKSSW